uniref:Uncharacterized protein n=1 Tax=Populus trichocarpa TaxID=3694 RepID=A0A2K1YIC2_POPTR
MNESELQENDRDDQSIHDRNRFLGFDYKSYVDSLSLCDALKCCLLKFVVNGADKVKAGRIGVLVQRAVRFMENMLLNRKVRVEFLSALGKVTASSSQPCIMRYKRQPIRVVETIIKSAPVIAGFVSESQILNIKMDEFTEGLEPTAFLKVMLEHRAEDKAGAGIPEIYAASLSLESELPRLKRLIWLWKRTIFVWISFILFLTELMFALVFCRPIIIPRGRPRIPKKKGMGLDY